MSSTAEQKIRQTLTGNPSADPVFKHDGPDVVRWLTGGELPDAWATFHHEGGRIIVRCAGCNNILGELPEDFEPASSVEQMTAIRQMGHDQHQPADWPPRSNITTILL